MIFVKPSTHWMGRFTKSNPAVTIKKNVNAASAVMKKGHEDQHEQKAKTTHRSTEESLSTNTTSELLRTLGVFYAFIAASSSAVVSRLSRILLIFVNSFFLQTKSWLVDVRAIPFQQGRQRTCLPTSAPNTTRRSDLIDTRDHRLQIQTKMRKFLE